MTNKGNNSCFIENSPSSVEKNTCVLQKTACFPWLKLIRYLDKKKIALIYHPHHAKP